MPTIAWFRAAPPAASLRLDDTADLIAELAGDVHVDLVDHTRAHDFVWKHARRPYDLCVYELSNTPAHAFIWAYVFHFPGVLRLRSPSLLDSRADALAAGGRRAECAVESAFTRGEMVRAPLVASRLTVVSDASVAVRLQQESPEAAVRYVPHGVKAGGTAPRAARGPVRFGAPAGTRRDVLERAAARARAAGAQVALVPDSAPEEVLRQADVIVALEWPSTGEPPAAAMAGLARARAVVVLETEATTRWSAIDPQHWQSRALLTRDDPVVVSIDPRDEEHSLMLAIRRLAGDRPLIDRLGAAGSAWWQQHATLPHAAAGWRRALADAMALAPPPRPADWPAHLEADGTAHARRVLEEMGVTVDFLR